MKISSRGFTLVELMIVIAIIGILAAALFPSLTAYLKRSRDAGRSANLNTIATAIGAFYSDKERYPSVNTVATDACVHNAADSFTGSNYFPKGLPGDPLAAATASPCALVVNNKAQYGYGHSGSATDKADIGYVVSAFMENLAGGNFKAGTATYTGSAANPVGIATNGIEKGTGSIYVLTN